MMMLSTDYLLTYLQHWY